MPDHNLIDPPQGPVLFTVDLPIRWSDIDAEGRVNNVQVLRFAEEARMQWENAAKLSREAPDLMPVVANVNCSYYAPIGYPVTVQCARIGRSGVGLHFEMRDAAHLEVRFATATAVWVWVDKATGISQPVPASLRAHCGEAPDASQH